MKIIDYLLCHVFSSRRILRWELPRLLAAIERLQTTIEREIASKEIYREDDIVYVKLDKERLNRLNRQILEMSQSANRIKGLLGYS